MCFVYILEVRYRKIRCANLEWFASSWNATLDFTAINTHAFTLKNRKLKQILHAKVQSVALFASGGVQNKCVFQKCVAILCLLCDCELYQARVIWIPQRDITNCICPNHTVCVCYQSYLSKCVKSAAGCVVLIKYPWSHDISEFVVFVLNCSSYNNNYFDSEIWIIPHIFICPCKGFVYNFQCLCFCCAITTHSHEQG